MDEFNKNKRKLIGYDIRKGSMVHQSNDVNHRKDSDVY